MPRRAHSHSECQPIISDPYGYSRSESLSELIQINDGFEHEDHDEIIDAVDHVFVPPNPVDESTLTEDQLRTENRKRKLIFTLGCLMAFTSGLTITVNNFIVKETQSDFGEILAVRSLVQIPTMLVIIAIQGHLGKIFPKTMYLQLMVCIVGLFGALTMMSTFACVKFMPVGDAMTLIFTNPLFTMIFAAIFLGHKLTIIKSIAAIVLMIGIVLVTKPPFLFPEPKGHHNVTFTSVMDAYLNGDFVQYDLKVINSSELLPAKFEPIPDPGDLYFVGAIIALSSALFAASNNIVIAKLNNRVPVTVQLLYIGMSSFVIAGCCQFVDERDRFFSPNIKDILGYQWGICVGIAVIGLSGFFCMMRSLTMIPPSTVATLRTSQIFVAFIAQVCIMQVIPSLLDILGAGSIFLAALAITFEKKLYKLCCRCRRPSQGTE